MILSLILSGFVGCDSSREHSREANGESVTGSEYESVRKSESITPAIPADRQVPVVIKDLEMVISTVGSFTASQTTTVGPQVSGKVSKVLVDVGDHVSEGQPLVILDRVLYEIEVDQVRAELGTGQIALEDANGRYERIAELWNSEDPVVARQLLDDTKAAADQAKSRLEQLQAAVRHAESRLEYTIIRAPFDGVVAQRLVDPGEPVSSLTVTHLLQIQQIDILELLFTLPQSLLGVINEGDTIRYQIEGLPGESGETQIDRVYPAMAEETRTFLCRALVRNDDYRIQPGLLAQLDIIAFEVKDTLVAPRAALVTIGGKHSVRVLEDGEPRHREIEIGLAAADEVQVVEGLSAGEVVLLP